MQLGLGTFSSGCVTNISCNPGTRRGYFDPFLLVIVVAFTMCGTFPDHTNIMQVGSLVPAESAELHVVDAVHTRMGASDNLAMGSSTFLEVCLSPHPQPPPSHTPPPTPAIPNLIVPEHVACK